MILKFLKFALFITTCLKINHRQKIIQKINQFKDYTCTRTENKAPK